MFIASNSYFPENIFYLSAPSLNFLSNNFICNLVNLVSIGLLSLVLLNAFMKNRIMAILILLLLFFNIYLDLNKLSGQYVINTFIFLINNFFSHHKNLIKIKITTIFCLYASFFFWSGCFKINTYYFNSLSPWFLSPLKTFSFYSNSFSKFVSYCSPFIEMLIPVFFLSKRTRIISIVLASLTHILISYCLSMHKIYPPLILNAQFLVFAIFFFKFLPGNVIKLSKKLTLALFLIFSLPTLSYIDLYPDEIAFHTFSGRVKGVILKTKELNEKMPEEFLNNTTQVGDEYFFNSMNWTIYSRAEEFNNMGINISRLCYKLKRNWAKGEIKIQLSYLEKMFDDKRSLKTISCNEFNQLVLPYYQIIHP